MAPFRNRTRGWIWAHPRRARVVVAATVVLTAVAAGGAYVGLRPDDGPAGRLRHGRSSGSVDTPGDGGSGAGAGSTAPAAGGATATGPGGTATSAGGAPGTTASGPGSTAAAPTSTSQASTTGPGSNAPGTGRSTTPATGPGVGRGSTPSSQATAAPPGWGLLPNAPLGGRHGHTAVWTGREMVIWGGTSDFEADPFTDGAAFDPVARTWRKLPAAPLSPRLDARAFWTGREMIVFGGASAVGDILADGAAWDPTTNRWRALPASPLGPRDGAVVAWAGDRLVVWGGSTVLPADAPEGETEMKNDGAAYVPGTGGWVPVAAAPIPARSGADSAWTGSRLVISGGYHEGDEDDRTDGAALDPVSGAWSPIAARPTPGSCGGGSACEGIWTGQVALFVVSGVAYDPAADRWSAIAPAPVPDGPAPGEPAVWTGRRVLSWGISGADSGDGSGDAAAEGNDGPPPVHGGMYDPVANRWQTFAPGPLGTRVLHTAVWTGQEMLLWGGTSGETGLADGAVYRPE